MFDWLGASIAAKAMLLEGLEIVFLVVALGSSGDASYPVAVLGEVLGLVVDDLGLACGVLAAVGLTYGLTREPAVGSSVLGGLALVGTVAASLATSLRRARRRHGTG